MSSIEEVLQQYRRFQARESKALYLDPQQSLNLVETCNANNIAVVGIEGFIHTGGKIEPRLDLIADFSSLKSGDWQSYKASCNAAAERFLRASSQVPNVVFSFVLLAEHQWKAR